MVHPFARPASPCCVFVLFLLSSVVFVPAQAVAVDGNRPPLRRLVLQDKLKAENRRLLVENKRLETFLEREQHNRVTAFAELPTKLPAPVVAPGIDKTDKVRRKAVASASCRSWDPRAKRQIPSFSLRSVASGSIMTAGVA